jgi:hypothetical protein
VVDFMREFNGLIFLECDPYWDFVQYRPAIFGDEIESQKIADLIEQFGLDDGKG